MTDVQINGQRFQTATVWTIDEVQLGFTDTPDMGAPNYVIVAHDPLGPNAGNVTGGVTINSWTDTLIDLSFNASVASPYTHLNAVLYRDVTDTQQLVFDVSPDQPI